MMNLDILFNSSPAIQIHIYVAMLAFFVGVFVLWRRKGTANHKLWGKVWVVLMVLTALTSFFINEIRLVGPFSPIHLISLFTLISLYFAVKQARSGDIESHRRSMKYTFIGAIGIAGTLAFMPGRRMYDVMIEPTFTKLSSGDFNSPLLSLFGGHWQLPLLIVVVVTLAGFSKKIVGLFRS